MREIQIRNLDIDLHIDIFLGRYKIKQDTYQIKHYMVVNKQAKSRAGRFKGIDQTFGENVQGK